MSVPTVYKDQEEFTSVVQPLNSLLKNWTDHLMLMLSLIKVSMMFWLLVVVLLETVAIYAARKGLKTGLLAETFGGQVIETVGIENMIGTLYTEGPKLMAQVEEHTKSYDVDIIKSQLATGIEKKELIE
ncbi:MAG: hypothetical protein ACLS3V_02285 [Streptococcus sp.]